MGVQGQIEFRWLPRRHKARVVIRGDTQKYGIDYNETFSPMVRMATIRAVIVLVACKKWDIF